MGHSTWKLFVSEDRSQALLSFHNEPEVALSIGEVGEGDGKRVLSSRPQHRPRGQVQLVIQVQAPETPVGLRLGNIVHRPQALSGGLPTVAQVR